MFTHYDLVYAHISLRYALRYTSVAVCRCHRQNVCKFYFLKFLFIEKL